MRNYYNVNIVECLKGLMYRTTKKHSNDFKFDIMRIISEAKNVKEDRNPRHLLWMARWNGTWCVSEGNVYINGTPDNEVWCGYQNNPEGITAFAVEITEVRDNTAVGNVFELVYAEHVKHVNKYLFEFRSAKIELPSGETINVSRNEFNYYKQKLKHESIAKITFVIEDGQRNYDKFIADIQRTRTLGSASNGDVTV